LGLQSFYFFSKHATSKDKMMVLLKALLLSAVTSVLAAPTKLEARQASNSAIEAWDAGAVSQYPIHESCNATQAHQIALGLNETILLAQHAKEHVLRFSNNSEIYRRYFGDRPPYEVIGAYDIIVSGDKEGVLFRCDNPDGNCDLPGKFAILSMKFQQTDPFQSGVVIGVDRTQRTRL